jgi:DNA-binding transcriptional regulator YiaG
MANQDQGNPSKSERRARTARWRAARDASFIRSVRLGLGLTAMEFVEAFKIDAALLEELERGRKPAESYVRAYYTIIARQPDEVRECLAQESLNL